MESFFEPSSCLDPSSFGSTSFLSFSSFADLTTSPHLDTWDDVFPPSSSKPAPRRAESDVTSDTSSPGPLDLFDVVTAAFDAESDVGIFHTPANKLSAADVAPGLTHRASGPTDWDSPLVTPSLPKSNYTSPDFLPTSGFSWDESHSQLAGATAYVSPTASSSSSSSGPLRVASNPALGAASKNPRAVKPIQSMPALKEEMDTFHWFEGSDLLPTTTEPISASNGTDDALVDNFDWVFGDYGLGEMDDTIFAAFKEQDALPTSTIPTPAASTFPITSATPVSTSPIDTFNTDLSWLPTFPAAPIDGAAQAFAPSSIASTSLPADVALAGYDYTIDPMAMIGNSQIVDDGSRPVSAPQESLGMLSAPSSAMSRSLTAPGMGVSAPSANVFAFPDSQQVLPSWNPEAVQQPSFPIKPLPARRASHHLTITVNNNGASTFTQPNLPLTPQSATFPLPSARQPMLQAPAMTRAGTQPLPLTRRMSSAPATIPAHLVRAQAIVQMQEAKEQAKRDELRKQAATRRINMAEASVMQAPTVAPMPAPMMAPMPMGTMPRSQPSIVGWTPQAHVQPIQSAQMVQHPSLQGVLTTTQPLVVHPPPAYGYQPQSIAPVQIHRVHPPPHPGHVGHVAVGPSYSVPMGITMSGPSIGMPSTIGMGRPMARMPSPRSASSRKTASPSKRSPSALKRRPTMQPGQFSWGEATFVNFTADDAQKLLTGVAPSGSQSKRKREEDAARAAAVAAGLGMPDAGVMAGFDMDREGSKRSRTGE